MFFYQASTVLFVNKPPTGGSCTISPTTAQVGDQLTVLCTGWQDELGVDEYNIFGKNHYLFQSCQMAL